MKKYIYIYILEGELLIDHNSFELIRKSQLVLKIFLHLITQVGGKREGDHRGTQSKIITRFQGGGENEEEEEGFIIIILIN